MWQHYSRLVSLPPIEVMGGNTTRKKHKIPKESGPQTSGVQINEKVMFVHSQGTCFGLCGSADPCKTVESPQTPESADSKFANMQTLQESAGFMRKFLTLF